MDLNWPCLPSLSQLCFILFHFVQCCRWRKEVAKSSHECSSYTACIWKHWKYSHCSKWQWRYKTHCALECTLYSKINYGVLLILTCPQISFFHVYFYLHIACAFVSCMFISSILLSLSGHYGVCPPPFSLHSFFLN